MPKERAFRSMGTFRMMWPYITLRDGRFEQIDTWTTEWCTEQAGHASHEIRTWIAAYAALAPTR